MASRPGPPGPPSLMGTITRAARRGQAAYVAVTSYEDELRAEIRQEQRRAESLARPSTSVLPRRCPACGEWNDASRPRCRWCGA